jgi:tetratricopeptide (TPR) repeat protein
MTKISIKTRGYPALKQRSRTTAVHGCRAADIIPGLAALAALVLLLTPQLCFPQSSNQQQVRSTQSFMDYFPQRGDFQPRLAGVVQMMDEALVYEKAKQKKEAQDKYAECVTAAEKLLTQSNRGYHDEIYQLVGFAQEKLGHVDEALKAYRKSLELRANNPVVIFRHAYLLKQNKRCSEAVPELREVLWRTKQNSHEALFLLAECLLETDQDAEALKLSQEAYKNNPLFPPVLRQLVSLRERQMAKEVDPAEKARIEAQIGLDLSTIVKQDPQDRDAALKYARLLLKQSDPLLNADRLKEAEGLAGQFAEQSKFADEQSVKVLFDAQIKQGQLSKAEQTLKQGLSAQPGSVLLKNAQRQLEIERGVQEKNSQENAGITR